MAFNLLNLLNTSPYDDVWFEQPVLLAAPTPRASRRPQPQPQENQVTVDKKWKLQPFAPTSSSVPDSSHSILEREIKPVKRLRETPKDEITQWLQGGFHTNMDIVEQPEAWQVHLDLPGVKEGELKVELKDNVLTVSGARNTDIQRKTDGFYHIERSSGSFSRSVRVPKGVDIDKISANFENGVLKLALPKAKQVVPEIKAIAVQFQQSQAKPQPQSQAQVQDQPTAKKEIIQENIPAPIASQPQSQDTPAAKDVPIQQSVSTSAA